MAEPTTRTTDPGAEGAPATEITTTGEVQQITTVDLQPRPVALPQNSKSPVQAPDAAGATEHGKSTGVLGEEVVWEGRYSLLNFFGRITILALLGFAWIGLAVYTWGYEHRNLHWPTVIAGFILLVLWLALIYRMAIAHYGHFYRLTSRRLFVMVGVFSRRRDQVELLKVNDVYTRQDMTGRLLGVGTVVVNTSEQAMPVMYLTGVQDPKKVMDVVWHYARAERDTGAVKVDHV